MKKHAMFYLMLPIVFLTACAMTSEYESQVSKINDQLSSMQNNQTINRYAPVELTQASESVEQLNSMVANGADDEVIAHQVYIADKRLAIARESASMGSAESTVKQAELNRKDVLLEQSRYEARMAKQRAESASSTAEQLRQRTQELEAQVSNLKTEETARGLILTLDDILFAFDSTQLKSGAQRTLQNVADFLKEYPDRAIMIEGFTDSVGSDQYNEQLSKERADAVKTALERNGIKSNRIDTRGYGEEYPVATNNTQAGRQENRRVEIVLSDKKNQPVEEREEMASR